MSSPLCAQRRHVLVSLVSLTALLASPVFASEIFKCVAKDGSPLFQNFPCDIDSIGSVASNGTAAKAAAQPDTSKTERLKPSSSNTTGGLPVGMSSDEVKSLLGAPEEMVTDEPATGGRITTWRYADGRLLQFDHGHRLLGVQR
jgi:hypothetical protein